jgi:hypothetical protein
MPRVNQWVSVGLLGQQAAALGEAGPAALLVELVEHRRGRGGWRKPSSTVLGRIVRRSYQLVADHVGRFDPIGTARFFAAAHLRVVEINEPTPNVLHAELVKDHPPSDPRCAQLVQGGECALFTASAQIQSCL